MEEWQRRQYRGTTEANESATGYRELDRPIYFIATSLASITHPARSTGLHRDSVACLEMPHVGTHLWSQCVRLNCRRISTKSIHLWIRLLQIHGRGPEVKPNVKKREQRTRFALRPLASRRCNHRSGHALGNGPNKRALVWISDIVRSRAIHRSHRYL